MRWAEWPQRKVVGTMKKLGYCWDSLCSTELVPPPPPPPPPPRSPHFSSFSPQYYSSISLSPLFHHNLFQNDSPLWLFLPLTPPCFDSTAAGSSGMKLVMRGNIKVSVINIKQENGNTGKFVQFFKHWNRKIWKKLKKKIRIFLPLLLEIFRRYYNNIYLLSFDQK